MKQKIQIISKIDLETNINDIARNYRGGGHLSAAGATLKHKKELKLILKELDERCKTYKLEHPEVF